AALKQESTVPVRRECERESESVRLAVPTRVGIDHAVDATMRRLCLRRVESARRHFANLFDDNAMSRRAELCKRRAGLPRVGGRGGDDEEQGGDSPAHYGDVAIDSLHDDLWGYRHRHSSFL